MGGSWPDINRPLNSQHCVPGKYEGIEQVRRWEGSGHPEVRLCRGLGRVTGRTETTSPLC